MRSKNKALMDKICDFVNDYYKMYRKSPSVNEIAKGVGVAKTTSYRYLVEMNEKGIISYDGKTIETSHTDKCVSGYFSAPVVGSVRCGDPETEEESVEECVNVLLKARTKAINGAEYYRSLQEKYSRDSYYNVARYDYDINTLNINDENF